MEASGIVAGTANEEAAQALMDWSITEDAMKMYNVGYAVIAMPGLAKPVEHFPAGLVDAMIENDFEYAANNRAEILQEWEFRYHKKSDPKN